MRTRSENEPDDCTMCWSNRHRKAKKSSSVLFNIWFSASEGGHEINPRGCKERKHAFSCKRLDYFPLIIKKALLLAPTACKNMQHDTTLFEATVLANLNNWVSSCQGLHCSPAALRLIVGSVVGLGLHFDLQAVRSGAGRQLPVESWQGRAIGVKTCHATCQLNKEGGELILDALIKGECEECKC